MRTTILAYVIAVLGLTLDGKRRVRFNWRSCPPHRPKAKLQSQQAKGLSWNYCAVYWKVPKR